MGADNDTNSDGNESRRDNDDNDDVMLLIHIFGSEKILNVIFFRWTKMAEWIHKIKDRMTET
jgi:hypothetical protein